MPAVSKKQAAFMGAIAGGQLKKPGLSPETAKEFVRGVKVKSLPTYAHKRGWKGTPSHRKGK